MIVAPVDADTTVAIAASVEAKRYGISTGTPVWEAKRVPRPIDHPGAASRNMSSSTRRSSPRSGSTSPSPMSASIDEVACRLLDNENSREAAVALAKRIKAAIRANVGECLDQLGGDRAQPAPRQARLRPAKARRAGGADRRPASPRPVTISSCARSPGSAPRWSAGSRRTAFSTSASSASAARATPAPPGAASMATGSGICSTASSCPRKPTQSRTIGHSHVLSPRKRGLEPTRLTARRLALKAASRLRRKGYRSRLLVLHGKFEDDKSNWRAVDQAAVDAGQLRHPRRARSALPAARRSRARSASAASGCAWSG